MKIKALLFFTSLISLCILLISNSSGAGAIQNKDRTGSPLSSGPCQTCHNSGAFSPTFELKLLDGENEVSSYQPGKTYTLSIDISASGASHYGFQAVALRKEDIENAGTFGTAPDSMRTMVLNDKTYVEHTTPKKGKNYAIEWTAPEMGADTVKFYAAIVAANFNGTSGGDGSVFGTKAFSEDMVSSLDGVFNDSELKLSPNPTTTYLQIEAAHPKNENTLLSIFNATGQLVNQVTQFSSTGKNQISVDVQHLPKGVYFLQLNSNGKTAIKKFIKT